MFESYSDDREAYRHRNISWRTGDMLRLPYIDDEYAVCGIEGGNIVKLLNIQLKGSAV